MIQSDFFKAVGAPLVNIRWSWGAVRPTDGAIFLRVWQDRYRRIDGRMYFELTCMAAYADNTEDLGFRERRRHVQRIRDGAASFMVMCIAKDPKAQPRDIQSFNKHDVFVGGKLVEVEGDWWLELAGRKSIPEVRT